MKILILLGSPPNAGTTAALAEEIRKGALAAGHRVELLHTAELDLRPCLGCGICQQGEAPCVHTGRDEMETVRRAVLEADGLKVAHMGDIGTQLNGGEISRLFGADALMVTAGSCTGLPAQEVWRMTEELFPKAIIPMHYRDGNRGPRRLEHIDNLINYFEAPEMIHWYNTDTIEITADTEPQVAVLKYMGK